MCLSIAIHRPECLLATGEHAGYQWVVVHNTMGYRCGYIRVPLGHPWHGKDYNDIEAEVHGGLTFGEPDEPCGKQGDDAYWFGFDCAHCFDAPDPSLPGGRALLRTIPDSIVRDQQYVEAECRDLCQQAARAAGAQ